MKIIRALIHAALTGLALALFVGGVIEAAQHSWTQTPELMAEFWITAVTVTGSALALNFGAIAGLSVIKTSGFRAALVRGDRTSIGPVIQVLGALLYLGVLAYAFYVWWQLGFPDDPGKVVHVIPDLSQSLVGLAGAALLVILGLSEA